MLSSAVILSDEHGGGLAEGNDRIPDQKFYLEIDGEGRDGDSAEAIDLRGDQDVRQSDQHGLEPGRRADGEDLSQLLIHGGQGVPSNDELFARQKQVKHDGHRHEALHQQSGDGGAHRLHVEDDQEQGIEEDIQQSAGDLEQHRPERVPDPAKHPEAEIVQDHSGDAHTVDPQVRDRHRQDVFRGVDEPQIGRAEQNAEQGEQDTQKHRKEQCRGRQAFHAFPVPCPEIAGNQNADADRDAAEQADHQGDQVPAGAHCRLRVCPKKTTDDQGVGRVIHQLDKIGQEHRDTERDHALPDRARQHIDLFHLTAFRRNIGVERPLVFSCSFQTLRQMSRSTSTEEKPASSSIFRSISGRA